ncbi:PREDICTED: olfactory receptor 145-like [Nanorana parkeri]|uniref:olfactory receptor 145-like n=1 Tax=Nanorana parkeri TaxID=125878 RepID=UPI0008543B76|nr:PREDICTED: olfactory receptor 145-like [Nanorana parkeri]
MDQSNASAVKYFIIAGMSDLPVLRLLIFLLVLIIYLITVSGNLTILVLVCLDHHLHTPMYFFLANLSILDISCSTITLHKILVSFISGNNIVSVVGCLIQIYMFFSMTCNELMILSAMGYDRYVAICNPLHYHTVMNPRVCAFLATVCWLFSFSENIPTLIQLCQLTCYKSNVINHFFCDVVPVTKLSCSDTFFLELYMLVVGSFIAGFFPFVLTFISYIYIIMAIRKIRTSTGRHKAFYTCSSHLTVVILLYSTLIFQYLRPHSMVSVNTNKLFSLFNTAAIPILNPLIYSLKNKDVKDALRRCLCRQQTQIKKR